MHADVALSIKSIALGEAIDAYVLDRCPAALNVGGRCRRLGYRFEWDHYATNAVLTLPDKTTTTVFERKNTMAWPS